MQESGADLSLRQELLRKLWHLVALALPAFYVLAGRRWAVPAMLFLSVLIPAADLLRLRVPPIRRLFDRTVGSLFRTSEQNAVSGSTWLIWGQTLVAVLFPPALVPAALTFGVVGDTAAALVGKRWGGPKWRPGKSLGGTAAFVVTAFLAGWAWNLVPCCGFAPAPWHVVLIGAAVAALAEGLLVRINDNFSIPIAGATAMWIAARLCGIETPGGIL